MNLYQFDKGYRYNSDTLLLYDFIAQFEPKGNVLDVGCGCGILGLLLKRDFPQIAMQLLDIQEQNCMLSKENAKLNNIDIASFICSNFLEATFETKWDAIVSNPPFYANGGVKSENEMLRLSRHSSALPFEPFALRSQNH